MTTTEDFRFCPICGEALPEPVSPDSCWDSYGTWKVTTEGDCEGRSVKSLGVHKGHIDDIAFHLAPACMYSLTFTPTVVKDEHPPKRKEVHIVLDIKSKTWDLKAERRSQYLASTTFKDRPVQVLPGQYYASVKLQSI
jgi:hypothetical protein